MIELSGNVGIRIRKLSPSSQIPSRATDGSTGYDIYAAEDKYITPFPQSVCTGILVEVPKGYDLQIRPRSGLALDGVLINYGTIDSDYRGELSVIMYTAPGAAQRIEKGTRIGQFVLVPCLAIDWQEVTELSETERGEGGFGSTGS